MLELVQISKIYRGGTWGTGGKVALDEVSFKLERGRVLGLVGEKGCGKSTIARIAVKLLRAGSGRIILDGEDVTLLPERIFRKYRKRIQIIFQHPESALDPAYTLAESITESFAILPLPRAQWDTELTRLVSEACLPPHILNRRPGQVSGGEIQRAVLARVLAFAPDYLILDEPTSMLDLSVQAQILRWLKRKIEEHRMGVLFISHDMDVVRAMCDHVMVMKNGRIVEDGPVERMFHPPAHGNCAGFVEFIHAGDSKKRHSMNKERVASCHLE